MRRVLVRLPNNLLFTKDTIRILKQYNMQPTRKDKFKKNSIILNHGNGRRIIKTKNIYLINNPSFIHFSSNKRHTREILSKFMPKEIDINNDEFEFPIVAKKPVGCQGKGVFLITSKEGLENILKLHDDIIFEEYKKPKYEYRFNILDGDIYQISRKDLVTGWDGKFFFSWVSLGINAKLHENTFKFIYDIIDEIKEKTNNGLSSYSIDIIKATDNGRYLIELNSAFGLGSITAKKLYDTIINKYENGDLEKYKVV